MPLPSDDSYEANEVPILPKPTIGDIAGGAVHLTVETLVN
jgi:hypothetical protein